MTKALHLAIFSIVFLLIKLEVFSQNDTTYYSSSNKVLPDAKNATYYELNNGEGRAGYIEQFYLTGELYGFANYQYRLNLLSIELVNYQTAQLNFDRSKEAIALGQITSLQFREAQLNLIRVLNRINEAKYAAKQSELGGIRIELILNKK